MAENGIQLYADEFLRDIVVWGMGRGLGLGTRERGLC